MFRRFAAAVVVLAAGACSHATDDGAAVGESTWGHLANSGLTASAPQFLVNKDVGATYRVCLASYMPQLFPGIEAEIDAAINAWGIYLGRSIPVEVVAKDLPRATSADTMETLLDRYSTLCGEGFDTVLGLAPLPGNAVGITSAPYTFFRNPDGSERVATFKRGVFFKDYDLQPTTSSGQRETWRSLRAQGMRVSSARDLLDIVRRRETVVYQEDGRFLLFPVMMHELGHVWGLCDQYEGSANCDALHSTSHIVDDSIMSSRRSRERLYLADDDIDGIRALAARPGFDHRWGRPAALVSAPAPEVRKALELARVERVTVEAASLAVVYSVVSTRKTKYEFAIRADGERDFRALRSGFESEAGVESVGARLTIQLAEAPAAHYAVRLRVAVAQDDGSYGPWTESFL